MDMIFRNDPFGNPIFGGDQSMLRASGSPFASIGDTFLKGFGLYVAPEDSLLQSKDSLTTISSDATKNNDWLQAALSIINSGVNGYFNSQSGSGSGISSTDLLQALSASEAAKQQAALQAKQQQTTLILAGLGGLALLAIVYFALKK